MQIGRGVESVILLIFSLIANGASLSAETFSQVFLIYTIILKLFFQ